jgi:hypothetical protein
MITAFFLGLVKTAVQGLYFLLTSLLSLVFTNYSSGLAAITSSVPMKVAAGIIDVLIGWSFFTTWVALGLIVLPLVKLARYIIGLVTKG